MAEDFRGLAENILNDTTAFHFSSDIETAGRSSTWLADAGFKADGSITERRKSAYLDLGSYINDAKGAANGIFVKFVVWNFSNRE